MRTLLRKNTKAQKAASIICIQSDFFKMKINREIYSPTRSLWIRPESLFLFFQYQGLRVIFVRQHSLFEFEGLFQLGVYNLIIVIQALRNKAMNRGTFWKGVWVVFIVFFSLSSWGFFFAPVEKSRGRPIKGWTPPIGTPIVIPGLVRPAATPEIESVDASVSKPTAA